MSSGFQLLSFPLIKKKKKKKKMLILNSFSQILGLADFT